jgi:uncharacterized damage-inducible protein DinB
MADFDPVGTLPFFRERHRVESQITGSVFGALPRDGLAYAPHPSSSTAGATAWTIVRCLRVCIQLTEAKTAEVPHDSHPDLDGIISAFRRESRALGDRLLTLEQRDWNGRRSVTANGQVLLTQPLGQILWLFHVDAIHHRGQLSTLLRPLGAKVPSIYGPSGDSQV